MSYQITEVDRLPGGHDDGTDDGVLHVKVLAQGLVRVPVLSLTHSTGVFGTATIATSGVLTNPDGTQMGMLFTVPAMTASVQSGAWLETTLYGRRIGVRFRRSNLSTVPPFTVWIDGVPYAARNVNHRRHAATALSSTDYEGVLVIADDLGPGPHTVRVSVAGDLVGGAARSLVFNGWICDRGALYRESQQAGTLNTAVSVLTTSAATVPSNFQGIIRRVFLHNTDVASRIVTLAVGGSTFKVITLAAGTSTDVDFAPGVHASPAQLTWKADAGAVVNGWAQEVQ